MELRNNRVHHSGGRCFGLWSVTCRDGVIGSVICLEDVCEDMDSVRFANNSGSFVDCCRDQAIR